MVVRCNVGIGISSPTTALEVIGDIKIKQGSGYSNYGLIDVSEAVLTLETYSVNTSSYPANIIFKPAGTERWRIDSGGALTGTRAAVGKIIGENIHWNGSNYSNINTSYGAAFFQITDTGSLYYRKTSAGSGNQSASYVFSVDSSGNLVVGGTSAFGADTITLGTGGFAGIRNTNGACLELRRDSTDGSILDFQKNGAPVGSIATEGGDMAIGNDDVGLQFINGGKVVRGFNMATNARADAAVDLGMSTTRFKDLYLSGGVNFGDATGGVGYSAGNAANTLDDYEEGTWTPTWTGDSSITVNEAKYTRIGRLCYIYMYISAVLPDTSTAAQTIYGLPVAATAGSNYPGLTFAYTGIANLHGTFPGITALVAQNSSYIYFHRNDGNTNTVTRAQFRSAAGATNMALILSGFYHCQ